MKSQRTRLLLVVLGIFMAIFSLVLVFAAELNIRSDLSNAVQHIEKVIFRQNINSDDSSSVTLTNEGTFARIETTGYNFMINNSNTNPNKITEASDVVGNTILGGEKNRILDASEYNVIIAGESNRIKGSSWSTIGGGKNNSIESGSYNTIAGGSGNKIEGNRSSIAGGENNSISGDYSVAMGFGNNVIGNVSVALGNNSNVNANNSFLWTDDVNNGWLNRDNTFAVVSERGMVVNSNKAHSLAKLRIGGSGSLVLSEGSDVDCNTDTKGVIKAENREGGGVCLCSCNGTGWSSLYGGSTCGEVCGGDGSSSPQCGDVKKVCGGDSYTYSGSCVEGKVIEGTGAYFVDKDGRVHRSCQTEDGKVVECKKEPIGDNCDGRGAQNHCDLSLINTTNTTGFNNPVDSDIIGGSLFAFPDMVGDTPCAGYCYNPSLPYKWTVKVDSNNMSYCTFDICDEWSYRHGDKDYYFPSTGNEEGTLEVYSTNSIQENRRDGVRTCKGMALCSYGYYEWESEICGDYKCGRRETNNSYSGYYYDRWFNNGVTVTGTKELLGQGKTCWRSLYCNNGKIEFVGEETCSGGVCAAYDNGKYSIPSVSVGFSGQTYRSIPVIGSNTLMGSCTLPYTCNDGPFLDLGLETCNCPSGYHYSGSVDKCVVDIVHCEIGDDYPPSSSHVIFGEDGEGEWSYTNNSVPGTCEWTCEPTYERTQLGCEKPINEPRCGYANGEYFDSLSNDNSDKQLCETGWVEEFNDNGGGREWKCTNGESEVDCSANINSVCCSNYPSNSNSYESVDDFTNGSDEKYLCDSIEHGMCMGSYYDGSNSISCKGKFGSNYGACMAKYSKGCYRVTYEDEAGFKCKEGYTLNGCECINSISTAHCEIGDDYPPSSSHVIFGEDGEGEWSYTNNSVPGTCEWTCEPTYERTQLGCEKPINEPRCGYANGEYFDSLSNDNSDKQLCEIGWVEEFNDYGGVWREWKCTNGESEVDCSADQTLQCCPSAPEDIDSYDAIFSTVEDDDYMMYCSVMNGGWINGFCVPAPSSHGGGGGGLTFNCNDKSFEQCTPPCMWAGGVALTEAIGYKCAAGYYFHGCKCVKSTCTQQQRESCKGDVAEFNERSCECTCPENMELDEDYYCDCKDGFQDYYDEDDNRMGCGPFCKDGDYPYGHAANIDEWEYTGWTWEGTRHYVSKNPNELGICEWTCDSSKGLKYDENLGYCVCSNPDYAYSYSEESCVKPIGSDFKVTFYKGNSQAIKHDGTIHNYITVSCDYDESSNKCTFHDLKIIPKTYWWVVGWSARYGSAEHDEYIEMEGNDVIIPCDKGDCDGGSYYAITSNRASVSYGHPNGTYLTENGYSTGCFISDEYGCNIILPKVTQVTCGSHILPFGGWVNGHAYQCGIDTLINDTMTITGSTILYAGYPAGCNYSNCNWANGTPIFN